MQACQRKALSACAVTSSVVLVGLLMCVVVFLTLNWQDIIEDVYTCVFGNIVYKVYTAICWIHSVFFRVLPKIWLVTPVITGMMTADPKL